MSVDLATLALKVEALEVDAASRKLDNLTAAGGRTEKAAGGVTSAFKAVGAALAAVAFAQSIRQAVELADSYTRIEGRLKLVTSSATELASVQNALYAISQRSRAEYLATADVYNRFAQATKGQGIAQAELLGITETLNKAFAISGASTSEAAGAMTQLSQGFSSGVLRGDEFNSVMESGGRVVDLLADYLGVGRGELRGMAEDGELTSDVLRNAITSGAAKVNEEFDKMPTTVGQAGVVLQNVLGSVLNDANKSSEATAGLSRSILELASIIEANKPAILSIFTGIVENAGWAAKQVAAMATEIKVLSAVAAGALDFTDYIKMGSTEEMTQWMTDFDHGMAGVRKELTETAAKLKELGEEDPELVDEGEFTKTQQRFESLRGQIAAYENQITGASINSQAQVKGTLELLRQKAQQEKDVAAATASGTGVQKLSADALEKLHSRLAPVHQAQLQYKKDLEEIEKAHKSGQLVGAVYSEALKTAKDRLDKATGASKEHKAALTEAGKAAKASAKEYQAILDSLEPVRVEQEEYNKALAVLNKLDPTHETERYKAALEELNKTTKEGQELENHRAEIMGDLDDYERQVAQARMTDAERQIDDINRQTDALIKYGYELAKLDPKYQALADEGAAAFGEKARKDIEAITDDANQMGKMFDDVAKSIQGAFSDMFLDMMDDTDNALDSIGDMFKKLLAQMATMAIAQPIIVPVVYSIGSVMGVSDASIAKSLGMDVSGLSGVGGFGGIGSLFSGGSTIAGGAASMLGNWGADLAFSGYTGTGGALLSASSWLTDNPILGSAGLAGLGSLAFSALTGNLNTQSLFQAGGSALGTALTLGNPIGGVLGGIAGSLIGGLFGDDNNEFGFDPKYSYGGNWNTSTGQLDSTYEKPTTSHWSGAIFTAYGEQIVAIQEAFNEQVAALSKALPEEAADLMAQSLAAVDYKELLAASSAGKWDTDYAEDAIEQVVTRYSEAMLKQLGLAVGAGVTGYLDSNGAAGLVGSDKVWGLLTTEVQENIETAFRSAGDAISAGDYEKGLTAITDVQTAIAAIESAMAPISEIIDTAGLSDYELSLRSVNQQFDAYSAALQAAGVDMAKYTDLETARGIKLAEVQKAEDERLAALAEQRKSLEIQIMEAIGDSAGALSATREIELAAMDESLRPLQERIYSLQDEATAAEAANEAAKKLINESITGLQTKIDDMITQYGDLTAAMAELDPVAATLVDSWRANKTELENMISGLASAMGELPEQTVLERLQSTLSALASATNGIANLNDQIFALQTGTASSAAIGLLKAREQELFASMATSLDPGSVASELASVITKRITMQASLEEDAVNARYKAEYEAANTVAELEKQLRTDQISALQDQISAAKTLVDVVSSMPQFLAELRYSDLSSLNPGDQLATAKGSFESIMASAMSGDAEAMQQLQSVGSSYLKEAQGYYGGATSQYAAVFADVTNALEQFGAQPVTDIDLLQSQVEYLQGIETATNTLNSTTIDTTDEQIDALIDVRDALTRREEQLAAQKEEDRQAVQAQIDQLKAVVTGQEAQIRQQAAMHAELMAQLAQANASLEALENTASLEAAAPA